MLDVVERAFGSLTKIGRFDRLVDVHHNDAAWEDHRGKHGIVHRKGAVRARAGEVVPIPGSMGTASYVGEGLGHAESLETCQHGAGRALSRTAARKPRRRARSRTRWRRWASRCGPPIPGASPRRWRSRTRIESVMAASASILRRIGPEDRPVGHGRARGDGRVRPDRLIPRGSADRSCAEVAGPPAGDTDSPTCAAYAWPDPR